MIFNRTLPVACIRIADITLGIATDDSGPDIGLDADMQRFSISEANPDISVEVLWDFLDNNNRGRKIFDSGGPWQLYLKDNAYWFHCTAPAFGDIPYKIARFTWDFSHGQVFLHRPFFDTHQAIYPLQYPLDELLILNLLSQGRGAEVHACGVVDINGEGYLFVGHSGAGKTTMARLWSAERGVTILSDDRIILKQEKDRIWMHGTPWHGEAKFAAASKAQLKRIYFIYHGRQNSLNPITGAEAASHLFSCSFPVYYSPEGLGFTIDFYGTVAKTVPCSKLGIVPTHEVIDLIRGHP